MKAIIIITAILLILAGVPAWIGGAMIGSALFMKAE